MIDVDNIIFLTRGIRGYKYHFITSDNDIYQLSHCPKNRTLPSHLVKMVRNGEHQMCKGFMIYGKFKSRTSLLKKSYPIPVKVIDLPNDHDSCPF